MLKVQPNPTTDFWVNGHAKHTYNSVYIVIDKHIDDLFVYLYVWITLWNTFSNNDIRPHVTNGQWIPNSLGEKCTNIGEQLFWFTPLSAQEGVDIKQT